MKTIYTIIGVLVKFLFSAWFEAREKSHVAIESGEDDEKCNKFFEGANLSE